MCPLIVWCLPSLLPSVLVSAAEQDKQQGRECHEPFIFSLPHAGKISKQIWSLQQSDQSGRCKLHCNNCREQYENNMAYLCPHIRVKKSVCMLLIRAMLLMSWLLQVKKGSKGGYLHHRTRSSETAPPPATGSVPCVGEFPSDRSCFPRTLRIGPAVGWNLGGSHSPLSAHTQTHMGHVQIIASAHAHTHTHTHTHTHLSLIHI